MLVFLLLREVNDRFGIIGPIWESVEDRILLRKMNTQLWNKNLRQRGSIFKFELLFHPLILWPLFLISLGIFINIKIPIYGDEIHYYATAQKFFAPDRTFLSLLKSYPEPISPLLFIIGGLLINFFGNSLYLLRTTSLISGIVIIIIFYYLLRANGITKVFTFHICMGSLILNPYFAGSSVLFYTDALAIAFGLLGLFFEHREKPILAALFFSLAIWTRQYFIFIPVGFILYELCRFWFFNRKFYFRRFIAYLLPLFSFCVLIIIWGGLSPINFYSISIEQRGIFNPQYVVYLVSITIVYTFPVLFFFYKRLFQNWKNFLMVGFGAFVFWFYIPGPNLPMFAGKTTLGFFDILITALPMPRNYTLFVFFLFGILVWSEILQHGEKRIRTILFAFLLINFFAHGTWDKYLLPVLPLIFLLKAPEIERRFH